MSYIVEQIHPLDLQKSIGIGVNIPFSSVGVFNTTYTTAEAIKVNLINYLLTGTSERYMNPNLGAGLRDLLFTQLTEDVISTISTKITDGISQWFPSILINRLEIAPNPDDSEITISLNYSILNTNIEDTITVNIQQ